ncbi:MAG: Type IIS restriction enzyme Eco57I [Ignavibacteriaceae bacterium]|nr:Type IIS restriction enzyme Eco57I [Ignavibacteriaceae bacterium]
MTEKEAAFNKISLLVKRFAEQIDSYKKNDYNETLTRRDFIDPFFKALGWDIDNESGYAESYREVIHEDKLKIGSATKAPDYSFRLPGGKKLFFVEAKKPSVAVKDEIHPAYQVRRYGWSAKLPISIITDFEEFAIYDCTKKPKPTDRASVARVKYLTFHDYLTEFNFFWETFSKESVLKGSFDKFIKSDSNKKGTASVDKEFLFSLDSWRTILAQNISKNNKSLSEDEINFLVQQTLDRIIFLRIAEDRGVENYGALKDCLTKGDFYQNILNVFYQADHKYNSGLFDFNKDTLSKAISIDNKVIKSIINELYYPESPYEFSVLSVEILGSAYEQFLGKTIIVDKTHKIRIEEKPEVRKAGGVYYTPQYIVEYIVNNTVGKLVEGKTPEQVSKLKIVDPACGSGSFLLGAYQFLLDWHRNYYNDADSGILPGKGKKEDLLRPDGNLTTSEKKRILLNNIYGVDIDVNAVEVTKLSLLLKCLEGETEASISAQLRLFNERVLPTLDNNIKSGNSLVDTDFYENELDFGEEKKVKPFNWQKAFPDVFNEKKATDKKDELRHIAINVRKHAEKAMEYAQELEDKLTSVLEPEIDYTKGGGFDAVIGNPPYVRIQTVEKLQADYFRKSYQSASYGNFDLYVLFVERALQLIASNGLVGMILPNKFFVTEYGERLRNLLRIGKHLVQINDFTTNQIFDSAATYTCLLFLNSKRNNEFLYQKHHLGSNIAETLYSEKFQIIEANDILTKWNFNSPHSNKVLNQIKAGSTPLSTIARRIFKGSSTGNDDIYLLEVRSKNQAISEVYSKALAKNVFIENELLMPFVYGTDVRRYFVDRGNTVLLFPYYQENKFDLIEFKKLKTEYPLAAEYFEQTKAILKRRKIQMSNQDFVKFSAARSLNEYKQAKILIPDLLVEGRFAFDKTENLFHGPSIHSLILEHNYLYLGYNFICGLLSSKIFWFYLAHTATALRGNAFRLTPEYIKSFPVKVIDKSDNVGLSELQTINDIVDQISLLKKEHYQLKLSSEVEQIESKINYLENKLDHMFYKLYELDPSAIEIIENQTV